jgi:ribose/xylose/arabinose/galactoside ABC-type transport system permease subunit
MLTGIRILRVWTTLRKQNFAQLWQHGGIYVSLIVVAAGLSMLSPYFFTALNLIELVNYTTIIAIVAIGQTFVIGGKGIDLSVGAVVAISAGVMGLLVQDVGLSPYLTMVAGIAFATLLGTLHGFLITRLGVPDLVVTLAGLEVWRGVVYLNFEERVISRFDPVMRFFGNYRFFGWMPAAIVLLIVLLLFASFLLRRTALGRYILAIGGNRKAAEYAGINYRLYKMLSYSISGFFCGVAALVLLGRLNAIQSSLGLTYELQSIAAVVIGGTSLFGGSATVVGAVAGALMIAMVRNGLMIGGINFYWYMIILGILLVASVAVPAWERRKEIR